MNLRVDNRTLELYLSRRGELVNYAKSIVGCSAQAEDVVQEAFVKFCKASVKSSPDDPLSYLFRIVRNLSIDWTRRSHRESKAVSSAANVLHTDVCTPDEIALQRDELRALSVALEQLDERTRTAVIMHRAHGAKLREIADTLGISVSLAHKLVYEGLDHCRRYLQRPAGTRK